MDRPVPPAPYAQNGVAPPDHPQPLRWSRVLWALREARRVSQEGWAARLAVSRSTVQRWEKREGMPIHRHVHDKRGSVYALSSELDTWLQSRKLDLEGEGREESAETPLATEAEPGPTPGRNSDRWDCER